MKDMKDTVLAGIYFFSRCNAMAHAKVWNVRIDKPVFHLILARIVITCRLEYNGCNTAYHANIPDLCMRHGIGIVRKNIDTGKDSIFHIFHFMRTY